ncbi:hypothetical protein [Motilimonas eburnea]|uniref:hypothetical protein n=1 Tax=Motilimonas eburnea TaxID=1737488 RepID=UPI001E3563E4|nr:hypothetical protein [Motilimonas eburnea]MCE2573657.1 hypothetical protein [Motilimonas eburnea]
MLKRHTALLLVLISGLTSLIATPSFALTLGIEPSVLEKYRLFLADRDPLTIDDYSGQYSHRGVAEVILIQKALKLGGLDEKIEFKIGPNYARLLKQLQTGDLDVLANSAWLSNLENNIGDFYVSDAVIRDGQFEAGLYTLSTRDDLQSVRSLAQIRTLSAVSNKHWHSDWQTLSALKLVKLYNVAKWSSMLDMVRVQRADFLLAPFQVTPDLSFTNQDDVFVPIAGIKLGLRGSRHFVVSRHIPRADSFYLMLQKGVKQLHEQGEFDKAYRESGFYNPQVASWTKISP